MFYNSTTTPKPLDPEAFWEAALSKLATTYTALLPTVKPVGCLPESNSLC